MAVSFPANSLSSERRLGVSLSRSRGDSVLTWTGGVTGSIPIVGGHADRQSFPGRDEGKRRRWNMPLPVYLRNNDIRMEETNRQRMNLRVGPVGNNW